MRDENIGTLEDLAWAKERVTNMCASALVNARVYGLRMLKGFGYPNETFHSAQDYRALAILLATLAERDQTIERLERFVKRINNTIIGSEGVFFEPDAVTAIDELKALSNRRYSELTALRAEHEALKARAEAFIVAAEDYRIGSETILLSQDEGVEVTCKMLKARDGLRAALSPTAPAADPGRER